MKRADPHKALLRALAARYRELAVEEAHIEGWASVTFTGTRHVLRCAPGPDLGGIEDIEFTLPGHVVIDIAARLDDDALMVVALLVEDA